MTFNPLISVDELSGLIAAGQPLVLLDIRDEPSSDEPDRVFLPGAQEAYLAKDFCGPSSAEAGRRPLPPTEDFNRALRRWGVTAGVPVIVYDSSPGSVASRAWWTLSWAGVSTARLLDGGLRAWARDKRPLVGAPRHHSEDGDFVARPGSEPVLDANGALSLARAGRLFDARGLPAFKGDAKDAATGRIPGAINVPAGDTVSADQHFKSPDELRRIFDRAGLIETLPIGVYCGSGNAAAQLALALALIDVQPALYVGSWSAYSADAERPRAYG